MTSRFTSGFCGVILVRDDSGAYIRRTWGEKSHRQCPGSVAQHECMCDCHMGETPWEYNGEWTGHRPVVLEPRLVDEPMQPRFTPVKRGKPKVIKPATTAKNAVTQMTEALEALRDTESDD